MECSAGKFLMQRVIVPFVCGSDDGVQTSIPFRKTETRIAFQERRATVLLQGCLFHWEPIQILLHASRCVLNYT